MTNAQEFAPAVLVDPYQRTLFEIREDLEHPEPLRVRQTE